MKLSVPFIPDEKYTNFLKNKTRNIESVYFPVFSEPVLDARTLVQTDRDLTKTLDLLSQIQEVKTWALMNSRFINPADYTDLRFLKKVLEQLETVAGKTKLSGIVFSDGYFLNALGKASKTTAASLQAVPGINCMLDHEQKILSFLTLIEQAGFNPPEKLIIDRSLNRDIKRLKQMRSFIQHHHPKIHIELLANEGCIFQCPFKLTHDAQIAHTNLCRSGDLDAVNRNVGCRAYFYEQPHRLLASPFIRPEDIHQYQGLADSIKICGRTLGPRFLTRAVTAYSNQSFDGNLFELMDASHWLKDLYHLDNKKLGTDFFNQLIRCTKACKQCSICGDLFETASKKLDIGLKAFKDFL